MGSDHSLQERRQAPFLSTREGAGHGHERLGDFDGATFGQLVPLGSEGDVDAAPVSRVGCSQEQTAFLGPVDQAGDSRLVQSQVCGQFGHRALAIAQDGQNPKLGQGHVVFSGDFAQLGRGEERRSHQRIDQVCLIGLPWLCSGIGDDHTETLIVRSWYQQLLSLVLQTNKEEVAMKAAVVTDFSQPPRYQDFPDPVAKGKGQAIVEVVAAGLHPRVRSQAGGFHYTSTGELPLVPGVDAVVRDSKGKLRYTIIDVDETTLGTMAERTVIEIDRSVLLSGKVDPVLVAAAVNPVMSSWVALRRRIDFARRQRVLILGATGNAGRMAIQVAKRFGASEVIAAGRDSAKLAELPTLGADVICAFAELAQAADVDVVIDYVWGEPTSRAMVEILTNRADRGKPLTWINNSRTSDSTKSKISGSSTISHLFINTTNDGKPTCLAKRMCSFV